MITRGMEIIILIAVNFTPKKDASNTVMGILTIAAAPI